MQIDDKLIDYLEDLSCLTLKSSEREHIKSDLEKILENMATLAQLDTTGVESRSHPFDNVNAYREDVVEESYPRVSILKNAKKTYEGAFFAPKTVL